MARERAQLRAGVVKILRNRLTVKRERPTKSGAVALGKYGELCFALSPPRVLPPRQRIMVNIVIIVTYCRYFLHPILPGWFPRSCAFMFVVLRISAGIRPSSRPGKIPPFPLEHARVDGWPLGAKAPYHKSPIAAYFWVSTSPPNYLEHSAVVPGLMRATRGSRKIRTFPPGWQSRVLTRSSSSPQRPRSLELQREREKAHGLATSLKSLGLEQCAAEETKGQWVGAKER